MRAADRQAHHLPSSVNGVGFDPAEANLGPMAPAEDRRAREVRNMVEPVAGVAFFAPEVHRRYETLGFPNPGGEGGETEGVRRFDWTAYFAARAACIAGVDGAGAAEAFHVFPVQRVTMAIDEAFAMAEPSSLLAARLDGTVVALERLLAKRQSFDEASLIEATDMLATGLAAAPMTGRPLFTGLRSLPLPESALGRWWRCCDQYREHRMDVHAAVLREADIDGCQACLLNDARQGLGLGTYVRTRGWTDQEINAAISSLQGRGLLDEVGLTPQGRDVREAVEAKTDDGQAPIVEAMADLGRFEKLVGWQRQAIIDDYGYPGRRFVEAQSHGG